MKMCIRDRFEPLVKDGMIYGRGSSDDKGPAVASLYALRCVRELNFPMKHKVRLILGTAEETGCSDIEYYLKKESTPPMVFSPDGDYPILNTEKGQLRPDVTAHFAPCGAMPRIRAIDGGLVLNAVPPEAEAVVEGMNAEDVQPYLDEAALETGASFAATDITLSLIHI